MMYIYPHRNTTVTVHLRTKQVFRSTRSVASPVFAIHETNSEVAFIQVDYVKLILGTSY